MALLRRFLARAPEDRRLLLRAVLMVQLVKLALGLVPFRLLRRYLVRAAGAGRREYRRERAAAERVAWAVGLASQRTLGPTTCLVEALAGHVMLAAEGHAARLNFGVARGAAGGLDAHAWIECGGQVVIGGPASAVGRYTPLLTLDAGTP